MKRPIVATLIAISAAALAVGATVGTASLSQKRSMEARTARLEREMRVLKAHDRRLVRFVGCLKQTGIVGLDDDGNGYATFWTNPFEKDVRAFAFDGSLDANGCMVVSKGGW